MDEDAAHVIILRWRYLLGATERNRLWFDWGCKRSRLRLHCLLLDGLGEVGHGTVCIEDKPGERLAVENVGSKAGSDWGSAQFFAPAIGYPCHRYSSASGRVCCCTAWSTWPALRAKTNW